MENIFLDTSFFIQHNYLEGPTIKSIMELSKNYKFKFFITEITLRELVSNFCKDFDEVIAQISQKKFSTLKNSSHASSLENIKNSTFHKIEFESTLRSTFSDIGLEILPLHHADLSHIVNDYFTKKPPFSEKKKDEFPDAITLSILKKYFNELQEKCLIVTNDGDFDGVKDDYLTVLRKEDTPTFFTKEYAKLLEEQNVILDRVKLEITANENRIKQIINEHLLQMPFDEESFRMVFDYHIDFHDFLNYDIQSSNYDIIFNDKSGLYLNYYCQGIFTFDFYIDNKNEDVPYKHFTCIIDKFPLTVQFQILLTDTTKPEDFYLKLNSINDCDKLEFWLGEKHNIHPQS